MPLTAGTRLGAFEIVGVLGAGGMGSVYRARDTKLGRDVAIKILPDAFRSDPSRLARFEREARVLASISHPNIGAIYGVEDQDGHNALVLELIEGETLATRLRRGPLSVRDTVAIARQIAAALQAAHEKGIVHRDLKPANINVTPSGLVKVLDFGLALAAPPEAAAGSETTIAVDRTQEGVILGTPAYMSPEQARGQTVDARTDVWSFGCVVFEMLTGTQPFAGQTMSDSIAAILARDPDWTMLPAATPASLRRLVQRCLTKDAQQRLRDIGEVPFILDQDVASSSVGEAQVAPAVRSRRGGIVLALGGVAVAIAAAVIVAAVMLRPQTTTTQIANEPPLQLTDLNDSALHPSLSPDGRILTFVRGGGFGDSALRSGQVYVKLLPSGEPVQLTRDVSNKAVPVFSPDGSRIVYTSVQPGFKWESWQVPVLGGEPQTFLPNASGLVWLDNRNVLFAEVMGSGQHMGITMSTESRGESRQIYFPPGEADMAHRATRSPDGKSLLIVEMDGNGWTPCRLMPFDGSNTGKQIGPLNSQCTTAAWSPDGHWMYFSSNADSGFHIWRQRFPDGAPQQITFGPTEQEGTAITPDGRHLVTSMGTQLARVSLRSAEGDRELTSEGFAMLPSLALAGDRVFYIVRSPAARAYWAGELWSITLATGQKERVLPGRLMAHYSISKDGRRVVFASADSAADGVWIADLGRRTPPVQLTRGGEFRVFFGADGEIVFVGQGVRRSLYRMKEDGSAKEQILPDLFNIFAVSPDGDWAAVLEPRAEQDGGGTRPALVSLRGGTRFPICSDCAMGFGSNRVAAPIASWSADGKSMYLSLQYFGTRTNRTVVLPYRSGVPLERQYPRGLQAEADLMANPGARGIEEANVFPGLGSTHLVWRRSTQSNVYRLAIPQ